MQPTPRMSRPPILLRRNLPAAVKRLPPMPSKKASSVETTDWTPTVLAVATRQDRAAFADLFEHFAPRVQTFLRRSGLSATAAEELAQETLILVWRKAPLFDPAKGSPSAWIFTIARNLRIDALRRERQGGHNPASDLDAEFQVDETPGADTALISKQTDSRVRTALAALSDDQKSIVELSFYQELAHAVIAEKLKIPLGTVKSRLRLAMNKLRGLLDNLS